MASVASSNFLLVWQFEGRGEQRGALVFVSACLCGLTVPLQERWKMKWLYCWFWKT